MKNLKFILHLGGVFGDKRKITSTVKGLVDNFSQKGPFSKRQILNICKNLEKTIQGSFMEKEIKVCPVFYPDKKCFLDVDIFCHPKQTISPFRKTIRFPNNLLGLWKEYQDALFFSASRAKKKEKLEQLIEAKVEKNLEKLFLVLGQDRNPEKRAAAVYLLAFSKKSREVSKYLVEAFEDSDHLVHNAVGWSLAKICSGHKTKIPVKPPVSLIHHPFPGCRNKGLILLNYLLREEKNKDLLLVKKSAYQRLLEISKNSQPNYYLAKRIVEKFKKI